jgi:hypothetical protein
LRQTRTRAAADAPAVLADTSKNRSCSETVLSSVM